MPGPGLAKRPPRRQLAPRCTTLRRIAAPASADDLYALSLDEFTPARNELEKQLRRKGERDEAKEVKALRKPSVAAWALNQLARRQSKTVKRLGAAGERLRAAQEDLMQGGDRQEMAEATAEERALVTELAGAAAAIAGKAGLATGSSLEEKLRATLHAAATDEETAAELMAGRLVREREAVGLFGLVEAPAPAKRPAEPKQKRPKQTKRSEDGDRTAAERAAAEEAKRRLRELERDLRAAAGEEKQARRHLQRAERSAASARERAEAATERLEAAEKEQNEASTALEEAAAEVSRLEEELGRGAPQ